ncbi:FAA hydrolase family protein [Variovorax guangxiensis]|uniref:FAA hydrolase family protein n=1 Tax=Variovorax guangxiensis TaxID=1775474 RepID=A0A3S0XK56_9BURK|nr:fumarylacetoacetate hydrolase family protein [Variovorax guangxiensis]RUR71267.1 FAA hydrolase family protein [Variovorax guangxiensis]
MKLMSYLSSAGPGFGVVRTDGSVVDAGRRLGPGCGTLKAALEQDRLPEIAQWADSAPSDHDLALLSPLPVIPQPGKIVCVGLNYLAHRIEGEHAPEAKAPAIFLRVPESQVGHGGAIVCPIESDDLDFEAEVAVVIGRRGRRIAVEEALNWVAGISAYNDASVRDWQSAAGQWAPGKNFPCTGAFGPWLVTTDELPLTRSLSLVCRVNGQEMQRSCTDLMIFSVAQLISHISTFCTLEPGDVIVTGTPGGVGMRRSPPVWLCDGDIVEVELEGVGILRNSVRKERLAD